MPRGRRRPPGLEKEGGTEGGTGAVLSSSFLLTRQRVCPPSCHGGLGTEVCSGSVLASYLRDKVSPRRLPLLCLAEGRFRRVPAPQPPLPHEAALSTLASSGGLWRGRGRSRERA